MHHSSRNHWVLVLLIGMASMFLPRGTVALRAAENPLPNPGFEKAGPHWVINDETSQITVEAAHTGQRGLRVGTDHYTPGGSSVISSRLPVAPGQEITLSFWARSKTATSGVYLFFYTAAGKTVSDPQLKAGGGFPVCPVKKPDGNWNPYTLRAKAPAGAATVAIWVHSFSGSTGITDFDDFALEGIAPGAVAVPPPPKRAAASRKDSAAALTPRKTPPVIILKLDDLKQVHGGVPASWQHLADYLKSRHIKASFGVICQTLSEAVPAYTNWLKERHASGDLEFWFHGWDHATHEENGSAYNEFCHRSYDQQKERLDRSQKVALEKLGFAFETFGPPGGAYNGSFDSETIRVMADDPYMKVWLYPQPLDEAGKKLEAGHKIVILERVWEVNLEGSVGVPDYTRFINGYAKYPQRKYFVLQGHPAMWSAERFAEFVKILDFLVAEKAQFMTPTEYAAIRAKEVAAP
jgi:peptidoglycan/xylan/chitin deacetylase (PgdA/CDA1 family)